MSTYICYSICLQKTTLHQEEVLLPLSLMLANAKVTYQLQKSPVTVSLETGFSIKAQSFTVEGLQLKRILLYTVILLGIGHLKVTTQSREN